MVRTLEEVNMLVENQPALMIYFYNDNCAPCVSLRPKVEELVKKQFPNMKILFSNSIAQPEVSAHFGAFNNPTIIIFFEGREYRRESKYISIPQLEESIQRPYGMLFS
jgi:thiol-disulfide isomerase/thioredoxin